MSDPTTSDQVFGCFARRALLWFVPALLLLPVALFIIAASMIAAEGSLLEVGSGFKGKLLTALGPMLVLAGLAVGIVGIRMAPQTAVDWLWLLSTSGFCIAIGYVAIKGSVEAIRKEVSH